MHSFCQSYGLHGEEEIWLKETVLSEMQRRGLLQFVEGDRPGELRPEAWGPPSSSSSWVHRQAGPPTASGREGAPERRHQAPLEQQGGPPIHTQEGPPSSPQDISQRTPQSARESCLQQEASLQKEGPLGAPMGAPYARPSSGDSQRGPHVEHQRADVSWEELQAAASPPVEAELLEEGERSSPAIYESQRCDS